MIQCILSSLKSKILQFTGIDDEHQTRMRQIELDHQTAMKSIQTQSEIETVKHEAMMKRIMEQSNNVQKSGKIDVPNFASNVSY